MCILYGKKPLKVVEYSAKVALVCVCVRHGSGQWVFVVVFVDKFFCHHVLQLQFQNFHA